MKTLNGAFDDGGDFGRIVRVVVLAFAVYQGFKAAQAILRML